MQKDKDFTLEKTVENGVETVTVVPNKPEKKKAQEEPSLNPEQ